MQTLIVNETGLTLPINSGEDVLFLTTALLETSTMFFEQDKEMCAHCIGAAGKLVAIHGDKINLGNSGMEKVKMAIEMATMVLALTVEEEGDKNVQTILQSYQPSREAREGVSVG